MNLIEAMSNSCDRLSDQAVPNLKESLTHEQGQLAPGMQ